MTDHPLPEGEEQRVCRLEELNLLDTASEPVLDAFTRLATSVTGLPISLLNLVDRERVFIKSGQGLAQGGSMPRGTAFCAWTIANDGILEVEDARTDDRFAHLSAVTGPLKAVHYVGTPLVMPGGERVGTICLIGHTPGRLQPHERLFLLGLAESIVEVLMLREREERLKREQILTHAESVAELSPVGLFAMDSEGVVRHANQPWLRLWGQAEVNPGTVDWLACIAPEDRSRVEAGWRAAISAGQSWADSFQLVSCAGKACWLSMRLVPVTGRASESAFVGAVADITSMKELAMELKRAHATLQTVLENLPCGLAVYDDQLKHVVSNRRLLEMLKMPLDLFDAPDARLEDLVRVNAQRGRYGEGDTEALVARRLDQIRSRSSSLEESIRAEDDALEIRTEIMPNGWQVQVFTDISRVHRTARALEASQAQLSDALAAAHSANKAKSEFLATMSHELRTPLNAILGFAQVLEQDLQDPEQATQARYIRQTGETLTRILNDVLDVAKIESGKFDLDPRPFAMAQALDSCLCIFQVTATRKGVAFEQRVPSVMPRLIGDPVRLQQILHNLLSNAFKFTAAGSVRLALDLAEDTSATSPQRRVQVRIEVADTGVGMTPEQLGRLFQRFEQASPSTSSRFGGTGLGLAIVQGLVHKMGGTVAVESVFGQGSRFVLNIPFDVIEAEPATSASDDLDTPEAPLDILVVDDYPINRIVLQALLKKRGHRVIEAEDGVQAINAVRTHRPALVLMDLDMPNMDGLEATRRIRELPPPLDSVPVYALTGKAFEEDIEKTRVAGMQGHLSKPVQLKELVRILRGVTA